MEVCTGADHVWQRPQALRVRGAGVRHANPIPEVPRGIDGRPTREWEPESNP
jgi:hypothetical protein